jgi:hypothetical protein
MFNLCLCISIDKDGYISRREILPACRTETFVQYGIEKDWKSAIHLVGNKAGLYRAKRTGPQLSDSRRTKLYGLFALEDNRAFSYACRDLIEEFLNDILKSNLKWGVKSIEETQYEEELSSIINNALPV